MYEIAAQYPQFTGGNNPNFEKFNQAARARREEGRRVQERHAAGRRRRRTASGRIDGQRSEHRLHVALAQDDLVSVKFDVSSYYQGAAHPNSYSDVLNYDLKNGKQLKLERSVQARREVSAGDRDLLHRRSQEAGERQGLAGR